MQPPREGECEGACATVVQGLEDEPGVAFRRLGNPQKLDRNL